MQTKITIYGGNVALVDAEDYPLLSRYKWHMTNNGYVETTVVIGGKKINILMHRFIMGIPTSMVIDHKDGDKLNNTKENLRITYQSKNVVNSTKRKGTSSKYKGVSWAKRERRWRVQIKVGGKVIGGRYFEEENEAGRKYNEMAEKYFGEFARLNVIENE